MIADYERSLYNAKEEVEFVNTLLSVVLPKLRQVITLYDGKVIDKRFGDAIRQCADDIPELYLHYKHEVDSHIYIEAKSVKFSHNLLWCGWSNYNEALYIPEGKSKKVLSADVLLRELSEQENLMRNTVSHAIDNINNLSDILRRYEEAVNVINNICEKELGYIVRKNFEYGLKNKISVYVPR